MDDKPLKIVSSLSEVPTEPMIYVGPLKGVCGFVQKRKIKSQRTGAKPWGWIVGFFISIFIFFVLSFIAYRAWKSGRKVAKLKHQIDVLNVSKIRKETDLFIGKNEKEYIAIKNDINEIKARIAVIQDKMVKAEDKRLAAHRTIESVTTWEDVNRFLDRLHNE